MLKLYDDLKPKFEAESLGRPARPFIEFDDDDKGEDIDDIIVNGMLPTEKKPRSRGNEKTSV